MENFLNQSLDFLIRIAWYWEIGVILTTIGIVIHYSVDTKHPDLLSKPRDVYNVLFFFFIILGMFQVFGIFTQSKSAHDKSRILQYESAHLKRELENKGLNRVEIDIEIQTAMLKQKMIYFIAEEWSMMPDNNGIIISCRHSSDLWPLKGCHFGIQFQGRPIGIGTTRSVDKTGFEVFVPINTNSLKVLMSSPQDEISLFPEHGSHVIDCDHITLLELLARWEEKYLEARNGQE